MKVYIIPKGTNGFLLTRNEDGDYEAQDWTTRREITNTDLVFCPTRLYNNPDEYPKTHMFHIFAEQGYAIMCDSEHGANRNAPYLLAVLYDRMRVLC